MTANVVPLFLRLSNGEYVGFCLPASAPPQAFPNGTILPPCWKRWRTLRQLPKLASLTSPSHRPIRACAALLVAAVLAAVFLPHFHRHTGLTSLIRFGERHQQNLPPELAGVRVYLVPHHDGFDGQYYAHMALHPPWRYHDLREHYDFPAYRLRRIFLPTLAWCLGLGQPFWIVHIYAGFNVVCWLLLAGFLTVWLPLTNWVNFGRWAGCLLAAGVLESLRGSLTDLPSLLLLLAGMRLWETRRPRSGALLWTASVLTRDTAALSVLGLLWPWPRVSLAPSPDTIARGCSDTSLPVTPEGCRKLAGGNTPGITHPEPRTPEGCRKQTVVTGFVRLAVWGGLIVLPTLLWTLYVSHYFPASSSIGVAGNFNWPFRAVFGTAADAWDHLRHGVEDNGRYTFRLITIVSFAVQAIVVLTGWRRGPQWLRMSLPFLLLFPFLGLPVWEGPWGEWRATLPVTIAFCFLVPANRWFWPLLLAGSLSSLHAFFRLIF